MNEPLMPSMTTPSERRLASQAAGLAAAAESMAEDAERVRSRMAIPDRAKAAQGFRDAARHAARAAEKLESPA